MQDLSGVQMISRIKIEGRKRTEIERKRFPAGKYLASVKSFLKTGFSNIKKMLKKA